MLVGTAQAPRSPCARRIRHAGRLSIPAVALVAISAIGLAGCANQAGLALARQACSHVERSLSLFRVAADDPSTVKAAKQQAAALQQLRDALQPAAIAAGEAPQWQALMTTVAESSRVPEANLVTALQRQCAVADSANPLLGPIGSNAPGAPSTGNSGTGASSTSVPGSAASGNSS
ncbi:MAG: hypothetical protein ACYCYD_04910 [Acidimicrobiales bacterium]